MLSYIYFQPTLVNMCSHQFNLHYTVLLLLSLGVLATQSQGIVEKILTIKTCGKPNIQNIMNNVTARPGQSATFKCQVDMSCIVAYIEWYHEMDNGTEKLIKTASSSGDPHVHIIKQVKPTDEGLYTCIAGNVLGQATASAYLEVNSGPRLYSQIQILGLSLLIGTLFRGGHAAFLEEHQHRGI
ncbi:kazal-type serine protease inhibitor domain-containing protein 1 [Lepeophtheirus salmonis]|uniref:kazal-type serine protease inhibitor domain-containing protein 1 n=1 Tax=Lepeophtheirus salmonis TaxID=72036 RepID=UPI00077F2296